VSQRKQIITSIFMGSAVAALSVTNVNAAQPVPAEKVDPSSNLVAQTPPEPPAPTQQPLVPNPKITIESAPTSPRAVPPPVGDISVSNMNGTAPQVNLNSTKLYSVTANQSAREILRQIAFAANLNVVDTDNVTADGKATTTPDKVISVRFRNEPIQNVFNNVLQLSGLEASRTGNTIFVSMKLPESAKETIVRSLRLNQITSTSASNFLATQGAEVLISIINKEGKPELITLKAPPGDGVLVLRGLSISSDERLNAITLVGSANKVEMASNLLTRLDARRRQVALNVKIVDVNLSNANLQSNSLSFKVGDGFLSVDKGAAVYNYGGYNPPTTAQTLNSPITAPIVGLNLPNIGEPFLDYAPNANFGNQDGSQGGTGGLIGNSARPNFGTTANPYQPGVTRYSPPGNATVVNPTFNTQTATFNNTAAAVVSPQTGQLVQPGGQLTDGSVISPTTGQRVGPGGLLTFGSVTPGTAASVTYGLPTNFQIPSKFLSTLQAQIISGNGKILTDPTLVVQEGQKSTVNLTQDVFGGFKINSVAGTGATTSTREPIIKQAGLILDILVNRIDDNGFVSVAIIPTVSSIGSTVTTADGDIALLQSRTLNSGEIRLRDGQTLILAGIIQESDRTSVTKVPVLGDIPILGALFRSTNKTNQRQEVVVLLTPQILNDSKGQVNYTPGVDARLMIGR
jgi:type IV pilus assembly protein PilQ